MAADQDRRWAGSMPDAYADGLGDAVFAPFAAELAARAAGAERVLEVAAGTGIVTRALTASAVPADVLATDLNPAMVETGLRRVPRARWQQADAAHLPAGDATVDAVVCGFGVMFFPDRVAAYSEARRVLRPGGRFLFTAWDTVGTHVFAAALQAALAAVYPADTPAFVAAVPHGYTDPARMRADLDAAGFGTVDVERVVRTGHAPSAAAVARGFCTGTPLLAQLAQRGDPADATRRVADAMTAALGEGAVSGEMAAYLVSAS